MKKILTIFILIVSANAFANNPFATGHYVAPKVYNYWATIYVSTTGNDGTGNGSIGNPYLTLSHAVSVASSGDIIRMITGTYNIAANIAIPTGVSIEGDGYNNTIINSTISTLNTAILSLVSPEGTNGNQHISGIHFQTAAYATNWGVAIGGRSNVDVYDCKFTGFKLFGCNFSGIEAVTGATAPTIYATGNSFYNNVVYDCAGLGNFDGFLFGRGGFQFGGQDGMLVYGNDIRQPQRVSSINEDIGWPIKMANEGWIKNCKIYNNFLWRYRMLSYHGLNENWNFSFEMWNTLGGNEFYNNTCQGAVDIVRNHNTTTESYSWRFYNNRISQPQLTPAPNISYGIELEQGEQDVYVYDNTFDSLTTPIVFSPRNNNPLGITIKRIYIYNNKMINCGTTGDARAVVDFNNIGDPVADNTDATDLYFYHNTVTKAAGASMAHVFRLPVFVGNLCKRIEIRDNILIGDEQGAIIASPSTRVDSVTVRNNLTYSSSTLLNQIVPPDFSTQVPIVHLTYSGNIINQDPLLNTSYIPQAGSPALNAATDGTNIGYNAGADVTPPTITSTNPVSGATGFPVANTVVVSFSENLASGTVNATNCYISGVTSSVSLVGGNAIQINPTTDLAYSTTYNVTITTAVTDIAGNPLAATYNFSFTTGAAPTSGARVRVLRGIKIIKQ